MKQHYQSAINYKTHQSSEAASSKVYDIDRQDVIKRLVSTLKRPHHKHFILMGESGSGRSYCLQQLQNHLVKQAFFKQEHIHYLDLGQIALYHTEDTLAYLQAYWQELALSNQPHFICIDEIDRFYHYQPQAWFSFLAWLSDEAETTNHSFGLCINSDLYYHYLAGDHHIKRLFETVTLAPPSQDDVMHLVNHYLQGQRTASNRLTWPSTLTRQIVETASQYLPTALPNSSLQLTDQLLGHAYQHEPTEQIALDNKTLQQVLASWHGIQPRLIPHLAPERLHRIAQQLNEHIIGHKQSLYYIQQMLINRLLNVSQLRHLTSLIFAGPPHVGKTATAQVLNQQLFGTQARSVLINLKTTSVPKLIAILDRFLRQPQTKTFIFEQAQQADNEVLIYLQQLMEDSIFYNNQGQPIKLDETVLIFIYQTHQYAQDTDDPSQSPTEPGKQQALQLILQDLPDIEPEANHSTKSLTEPVQQQLDLPDPIWDMSHPIYFGPLSITDREHIIQKHCQQLEQRAMISYGVILQFEAHFSYRFLRQFELHKASPQTLQAQVQNRLNKLLSQHLELNNTHQWQELLIQIDDKGPLQAVSQQRLI